MTLLQSSIVASGATGSYQIARSLRFNSADSAYLNRTPATNGNRKTWTFSTWVKRSSLGALQALLSAPYAANSDGIRFETSDAFIIFSNDGTGCNLTTTQVFRDVSSWYHILVAVDTTQATSSNRIKLYVNGTQVTVFGTATYPTQNYDFNINANVAQNIGRNNITASQHLGGYMTEIYFIDGQALTPSSFGQTDSTTGVWSPIAYTGTYGTNGFYLNFSDNSNTTAATLGKDSSGNGNNWTPNNFSVTAGVGNDSLVDSPTNYGTDTGAGGEVRGNYCTWNPLKTQLTLLNGNMDANGSGASWLATTGTMYMRSGKWYAEVTVTAGTAEHIGIAANTLSTGTYLGSAADGYAYASGGTKYNNNVSAAYGATFTTNNVIGIAVDMDNGLIWWSKNGVWQASGNPATGANPAYSGIVGEYTFAVSANGSGNNTSTNFGQRPFAYTAPSGFKALCTTNLPTPAIGASAGTLANKNMNVVTYTGDGTNNRNITGVGFQPDLVWVKSRSNAYDHQLVDAVRGAGKELYSNLTNAESTLNTVPAFISDGFQVNGGTYAGTNGNGATFVGWSWNAGGSNATNTSGTITSTVRANPTAGISVVTYTGSGANATVGHGLGVAPSMIIGKRRNTVNSWGVYHKSIGNTGALALDLTIATDVAVGYFNNTSPTSSVFTVGTGNAFNANTSTYVAYCFAEIAGFSKFGSYTGNGSADGAFVYCGFRPRFMLVKRTDTTSNWVIIDTSRAPYNVVSAYMDVNLANVEGSYAGWDILSNGIKLRNTDAGINASGGTYIFAAFAEAPFNYARAR